MSQTKHETLLPLEKPNHFLQVLVYYHLGGMCYGTYKQKPRGYYLSAGQIEREKTDFGYIEKFGLFSASCWLLEEAKRLNGKRLKQLADEVSREVAAKSGPHWEKIVTKMPIAEKVA